MKQPVDPEKIIDDIEQLRINQGLTKSELSRRIGYHRSATWAEVTRQDRHDQSHHQIQVITRALKALGFGLYIAPLPQEENSGQR